MFLINPINNKKVSLNTNLAKKILNNYINIINGGIKDKNKQLESKLIINDDEYHLEKILGKGGNGLVGKYINKKNNKIFAIKILFDNDSIKKTKEAYDYLNSQINEKCFENILFIESIVIDNKTYFKSEVLDGMIIDLIKQFNTDITIDKINLLKNIIFQSINGLRCLHEKNIVHGDIKPGNIFYKFDDDKIDVKIADLDCIAYEKRKVCSYTKKYTPFTLRKSKDYNKSIDLFALGMTFLRFFNFDLFKTLSDYNEQLKEDYKKRNFFQKKLWDLTYKNVLIDHYNKTIMKSKVFKNIELQEAFNNFEEILKNMLLIKRNKNKQNIEDIFNNSVIQSYQ